MSVTGTNISLTLRQTKGSELTYAELDGNQSGLKEALEAHSHNEFAADDHDHAGVYDPAGTATTVVSGHVSTYDHTLLHAHSNKTALDLVSGTNTGDQDLSGYSLTTHNHSGTYEPADATILKDADIGVTVQAYDADLTSWAGIAPSAKQDTLVSGTNIKTVNGTSLLGSGDITISGGGGSTLVFPFYKAAGSSDTIALIGGTSLPFYDSSNTSKNIALIGG